MEYRLRIALRYLLSPKSHTSVNVISMVSVCGVAVTVAAIVCVLSVFNGFNSLILQRSSIADPDMTVSPASGKTLQAGDPLLGTLSATPGVAAVTAVIEERALAIGDNGRQVPVRILGVDDNFGRVSLLPQSVIDGVYGRYTDYGAPMATIGVGVALDMDLRPGPETTLRLMVPRRVGRINPANVAAAFRTDTLTLGGVIQTDEIEYDADMVIIPIERARMLLQHDDNDVASSLYLSLDSGADPATVARAINDMAPGQYVVKDRAALQESAYRMVAVEKWITFAMMAFILLVASFNIISTLSMLIVEKSSTIGILRALGASRADVAGIFSREGWLICAAGGICGLLLGTALCLLQQHLGLIRLNGDSTMLITEVYPVSLQLSDIAAVGAITIATGWLTSAFTTPFARRHTVNDI